MVHTGSATGLGSLHLLYNHHIPMTDNVTTATFADDIAILATGVRVNEATARLQPTTYTICDGTKK